MAFEGVTIAALLVRCDEQGFGLRQASISLALLETKATILTVFKINNVARGLLNRNLGRRRDSGAFVRLMTLCVSEIYKNVKHFFLLLCIFSYFFSISIF